MSHSPSSLSSRWAIAPALLGLTLALGGLGCTVRTGAAADVDYPVAVVEAPPPQVETYPSVVYRGRPTYYVGGQWYYRSGTRWSTYRREPVELSRRRPAHAVPVPAAPVERGRYRSY